MSTRAQVAIGFGAAKPIAPKGERRRLDEATPLFLVPLPGQTKGQKQCIPTFLRRPLPAKPAEPTEPESNAAAELAHPEARLHRGSVH